MSQPSPALAVSPPHGSTRTPQTVATIGLAVLVIAIIGRVVFALWEPPFEGSLRYDDLTALGSAYWPTNLLLGGPSWALSFVVPAVFLALLGRGPANVLTVTGALGVAYAGIVFALTITAETLPFAFATDPDVFAEADGRGVVDVLNAHLDMILPAIVGTTLAIGVSFVVGLIGAALSRTVPVWFAAVGIAYVVVFVFSPLDVLIPGLTVVGQLLQYGLLLGVAWCGWRTVTGRARRSVATTRPSPSVEE